jgi:hypothetical protein
MKIPILVSPVVFVGAFFLTHPVHSETVSTKGHSPSQVKGNCSGGTYFAPGGAGVYGCIAQDGSGIVCGGVGKYKNTCDTFGPSPDVAHPRTQLPSREEITAQQHLQAAPK